MRTESKANEEVIRAVSDAELPPEFKKFDKPLGLEQHVFNIILIGILGHGSIIYFFFYLAPFGYVPMGSVLLGKLYQDIRREFCPLSEYNFVYQSLPMTALLDRYKFFSYVLLALICRNYLWVLDRTWYNGW